MVKKYFHLKIDNLQTYPSLDKLIKSIDKFDYVSFDIFDTLVKRDVPNPIDVFTLVEHKTGIRNFKERRINAEATARANSVSGEVTLKEIYDNMPDVPKSVEELEKQIEIDVVVVNHEIVPFFDYCLKKKKVILISDMYLDRITIVSILKKCGITGYMKLYISNEFGKSKSNGALFRYVLDDLHISSVDVLHIGNAFRADYIVPKKLGIHSVKVSTYKRRTINDYKNILCPDSNNKIFLDAFLNNHTYGNRRGDDFYKAFGYEVFGPLIYGFIKWFFQDMSEKGIEQVLFLARDGYIIQKGYHLLGFDKKIKDYYFEASRRSLRVPGYNQDMSFEDFLHELTVPNKTTLVQIFDSLGIEIANHSDAVEKSGIKPDDHLKRDSLYENQAFKSLFNEIRTDILLNAENEKKELIKYLKQFDFSKKTAIIDIGWGGSMQMYLIKTLSNLGIESDINGYYIGLTQKSKENLGSNHLAAKGYAFDRLNDKSNRDMERPFVGLFETLFLEQNGSVKRYITQNDGKTEAVRYDYEYLVDGKLSYEAFCVKSLQDGAMKFVEDFGNSVIADYVGFDSSIMFSNLYQFGIMPTLKDTELFGDFEFFNNGSKVYLAKPDKLVHYIINPKKFIRDLFDSQWKIGFLKRMLKLPLPYLNLFDLLRKASN